MQKIDNYSWLRDKNWPKIENKKILEILAEEKTLVENFFQNKKDLVEELFNEIKDKIPLEDFSLPYLDRGYYYYSFIKAGDQYWKEARRKSDLVQDPQEILDEIFIGGGDKDTFLDQEALAKNQSYFDLCHYEVSPCNQFLAYAVDYLGDQRYKIIVTEIDSGKVVATIEDTMGEFLWHEKDFGLFYLPANEFWRADKILYKNLRAEKIEEIYHEKDYTFHLSLSKSEDRNYLIITSRSYDSSEIRLINWDGEEKVFFPRKDYLEAKISPWQDIFFKLTNDLGFNKRLVKFSLDSEEEVIALSNKALVDFHLKKNHLILEARNQEGLPEIILYKIQDTGLLEEVQILTFEGSSYHLDYITTTFDSEEFLIKYSSPKEPKIIYAFNLKNHKFTIARRVLLENFNPDLYEVKYEKVKVPATYFGEEVKEKNLYLEGEIEVPVTIFYKKGIIIKPAPTLLYGYGSYGLVNSSHFRPSILPLVDRGFIYAIAHIRGGGEKGKAWYEAGKKLHKKNTFEDFIRVGEYLKEKNYTSDLAISGGSAGGLLIGYCLNRVPNSYKAAIMQVPFLDVLNTMLDDKLPLTPGEFKEWGNPIKDKESYLYIESYSPYDNINPIENYPDLYLVSGLRDNRVTYWEPLKFVRKLRDLGCHRQLLLKMEDTGHSGASGRFDYLRELAESLVFLLESLS